MAFNNSGEADISPGSGRTSETEEDDTATKKPKNWASRSNSKQLKYAEKQWALVDQAYTNNEEYAARIRDYWNIYNCYLDENQTYTGYSQIYVPIVRDCIKTRRRRILSLLFPLNDRHVAAVSSDNSEPYYTESILEHYIAKCDLKTTIGAMLTQGDVTGQWNLYVDWTESKRRVTKVVEGKAAIDEDDAGVVDPTDTYEDIGEEDDVEDRPDVWVPATSDIALIPPTVDCVEDAEICVIMHRYSGAKVRQMIDDGQFVNTNADELLKAFVDTRPRSQAKKLLENIGVKTIGTAKHAEIFEAHMRMKLDEDTPEAAVVWYRGDGKVLGVVENPRWSKRRPLISAPVDKLPGVFFGKSPTEAVRFLQWQANDIQNVGQDAALYALQPIVMSNPESNPAWQSMVITMAAVWPVDPNQTKILEFPKLWQDSLAIVGALKAQVRESMNVSEYEAGQMPQGRKTNAQLGAVSQSTQSGATDEARDVENRILNPLLEQMFELDQQYRDDERMIMVVGQIGERARMERVSPRQFSEKYCFSWIGTDYENSIQRIQQMIAAMNVLRGIPPQALNGKRLDIVPILEQMVTTVFGSRLAPQIIIDERDQLSMSPEIENDMLHNGLAVIVSPMDNDILHMQAHQALAQTTGDPSGHIRVHMINHMKSLQQKAAMANPHISAPGQGMPGGSGPGVPGTPRVGAQPGLPRAQGPPGSIPPDQMASTQ